MGLCREHDVDTSRWKCDVEMPSSMHVLCGRCCCSPSGPMGLPVSQRFPFGHISRPPLFVPFSGLETIILKACSSRLREQPALVQVQAPIKHR